MCGRGVRTFAYPRAMCGAKDGPHCTVVDFLVSLVEAGRRAVQCRRPGVFERCSQALREPLCVLCIVVPLEPAADCVR
ncbi:hypothetical protein WS62_14995 [Burkholderia sp. ABCPW 14]|nr:hypothetical protein WS62_14995 [Burkholderia sp. ABCPW 14]